jgi:hypothetical protein
VDCAQNGEGGSLIDQVGGPASTATRAYNGPADAPELPCFSEKTAPSVSVTNSPGSIIAPSGGTNSVVNQAPPPDLKIDTVSVIKNADGTYTESALLHVIAPYPVGQISIVARAPGIKSFEVAPQRAGTVISGPEGVRPDFAFVTLEQAFGTYQAVVVTAAPQHVELEYQFQ